VPIKLSFAGLLPKPEAPLVIRSVGQSLLAFPVLDIILPVPFVNMLCPFENSEAIGFIVLPLPFVSIAVHMSELASSIHLVRLPFSNVLSPV
jgi:hypothetical protein